MQCIVEKIDFEKGVIILKKSVKIELSIDELQKLASALIVDFSRLEADIQWNEQEYNSPKKPYEIFSFGKHIETLLGEKKKNILDIASMI